MEAEGFPETFLECPLCRTALVYTETSSVFIAIIIIVI